MFQNRFRQAVLEQAAKIRVQFLHVATADRGCFVFLLILDIIGPASLELDRETECSRDNE